MEKSARKTRTRNFREIELLIWLLIMLALSIFGFSVYSAKQKSYELHNIFMPDVDGLIVGSPVNFMGVPVGYVTKLKIVNDDEVFVRFIIKDKSVKLPKGTIANVEFSGLGGSKSIELYPPDPKYVQEYGLDGDDYIIVAKPKRLHDCWKLLYQMFTKLGSIIYKVSIFGDEIKSAGLEEESSNAQKDVNNFLEFSNDWVDNIQKNIQNYRVKLEEIKKESRSDKDE